jgi:hypothetical protein
MGNKGVEKDTQNASGVASRINQPEKITAEERFLRIQRAAYDYSLEREDGQADAVDDWLKAEADIDRELDGTEPSASNPANRMTALEPLQYPTPPAAGDEPARIEPDQIGQWAVRLGVSKEELRVAVRDAGAEIAKVKEFLQTKKR